MKTLEQDAVDKIRTGELVMAGAARLVLDQIYRFWSGHGLIEINSEVYKGIGAAALITPVQSSLGGAAEGANIELSNLDPDIVAGTIDSEYHQAPIVLYRLIFADDRQTLLGSAVFMRGRIDTIEISETVGGSAAMRIAVEGPRRDMNRGGSRIRADMDQRVLGGASDGGMKHISVAGKKTLVWGQKPESAPLGGGSSVINPSLRLLLGY